MSTGIAEALASSILESGANKMEVQIFIVALPLSGFQESTMQNYVPVSL